MNVRTYVLLVMLLSLIGILTVHEVVRQTRTEYRIADVLAREEKLKEDFSRLKAELAELKAVERLQQLSEESMSGQGKRLVPLEPVRVAPMPEPLAMDR